MWRTSPTNNTTDPLVFTLTVTELNYSNKKEILLAALSAFLMWRVLSLGQKTEGAMINTCQTSNVRFRYPEVSPELRPSPVFLNASA